MEQIQSQHTTKPGKAWPKWLLGGLLILPVLVLVLIVTLPYSLPHLLASQHMQLQFSDPAWHFNGFSARRITFVYQGNRLDIDNFQLGWRWFSPVLEKLEIDQLDARLQPDFATASPEPAKDQSSTSLDPEQQLPAWLPQYISIHSLNVQLPGHGIINGRLLADLGRQRLLQDAQQLQLELQLDQPGSFWQQHLANYSPDQIALAITLAEPAAASQHKELQLTLETTGEVELGMQARLALQWQPQPVALISQASLQIALQHWQFDELQAGSSNLRIDNAQFAVNLQDLLASSIRLPVQGSIKELQHPQLYPQNWQLNGEVSGNLQQLAVTMQLDGDKGIKLSGNGRWQDRQLEATVELASTSLKNNNPLARTLRHWPDNYQLHDGSYEARAEFHYQDHLARGRFYLGVQNLSASLQQQQINNLGLRLGAAASLLLEPDKDSWQLDFDNTGVGFVMDSLQLDQDTQFEQLSGALVLQGRIKPEHLDIKLSRKAQIESKKNRLYRDLKSDIISASLAQLSLQGNYRQPAQLAFAADFNAQLQQLRSRQLKRQDWHMHSKLHGTAENWHNHTSLESQHGFSLDNRLQGNSSAFSLHSQLARIDFSLGNPIEKTLHSWPELLSLDSGTIDNQLTLQYRDKQPLKLEFASSSKDINGIYNSSELAEVNLELGVNILDQRLHANIGRLSIHAINPGIPLNAISVSGANYQASLEQPLAGILAWDSIYAQLLNGHVYVAGHSARIDQDSQITVEVDNLELQELIRVYPTEGLEGDGIIDGKIPLTFSIHGISVEQGRLAARQPGRLRFTSSELEQMSRSNPGLQILNQALEDFHFKVLTSDLSFAKDGKLVLSMRLEGNNPNFERGRPIHFNFNLEQNLFALLASIQLTNQVNDLILQRLQQRALNQ